MTDQANLPMLSETPATGSLGASTRSPVSEMLRSLPARLDDRQMAMVEEIANSRLPALPHTDESHLAKCMLALDANLPRRQTDNDSAKLRIATWAKFFGEMPRQQVEFMCRVALTKHTFFPTIAEFLAIAKEWERGDAASQERALARGIATRECERRRMEARQRLRYEEVPQAEIDAMPEWLREALADDRVLVRQGGGFRQSNDWRDYQAFVESQGAEA